MKRAATLGLVVAIAACAGSQPPAPAPVVPAAAPAPPATSAPSERGETALTTRRWKYAGYFVRLKRAVNAAWRPFDAWKAVPEARRQPSPPAMLETILAVELTAEGAIAGIEVSVSSGVPELDAEAIRAFHASAPFGPTPHGLPLEPFNFTLRFELASGTASTRVAP